MEGFLKIIVSGILLVGLLFIWYRADEDDYFKDSYRDMTYKDDIFPIEGIIWSHHKGTVDRSEFYRQHFTDTSFVFPRQQVETIKIFKNIPMLGIFTVKKLKRENNNEFLRFCNDTTNFTFKETSWALADSEYYVRLYDKNENVVGKIYFCLKNCGMTEARPFCPAMKYGGLSKTGIQVIITIINNEALWE